jgi:GNAT superfamily N-acetyltransferase
MMRIRRAVLDDRDSFATIRRDAILVLATSAMSQEAATAWAMNTTEERFIRAIEEHVVWFAEAEAPLGWVEVADDRVNGLYVSPSHARRGVGSILLAHAESSIRAAGYAHVKLRASPNALPFYLRRGYVRVGESDADGAYALHKALHS